MPVAAYSEGQVINPKEVGKTLKETLKTQFRPRTRHVALSVGGQSALVRRLALPKLPLRRLRSLLETQGDQWIPFLREGASFDIAVVEADLSEQEQEILLVAVPTRIVEGMAQALRYAGLRLAALDVDIAAHYRAALAARTAPREGVVGILDMDQDRARLGLFQDGTLATVRSLETIPYLPAPGEPPPDPMMLEGFAVDVRRALEMMLSQVRGNSLLSALAVVSARWPAKEMMGLLERELQGEMGHRLNTDFQVRPAASADMPPGSSLAFGLALTEASPPKGLDLLPRASLAEQRRSRFALTAGLALILGVGLYGLWWSQMMPAMEQTQRQLQVRVQKQNQLLEKEVQVRADEDLATRLRPIIEELKRAAPLAQMLPELKDLLPPGLVITALDYSTPELLMGGTAPGAETVTEFMEALEDSAFFDAPLILNYSELPGQGAQFELSVNASPREVEAKQ